MRHITYTTCFDEVSTAVVPNLPDHVKPCHIVPLPEQPEGG
jgi:hypothetical protein